MEVVESKPPQQHQQQQQHRWSDSAAALRFPSVLLIPFAVIYDNTASASVSLTVHSRESYDFGLGVFGLTVCVCGAVVAHPRRRGDDARGASLKRHQLARCVPDLPKQRVAPQVIVPQERMARC